MRSDRKPTENVTGRSAGGENERIAFGTRLPPDLVKRVKMAAVARDLSVQEVTERALREALDTWLSASD